MKKIAVMLPVEYRGGSLRAVKNIAKSVAYQARQRNDDVQVVFSYVKQGKYNPYIDFDDLQEYGIVLRETVWEVYPRESLRAALNLINNAGAPLEFPSYCVPLDGANDFYDCDLWIIISDRLPAPLFPLQKSVFFVYDYIQRYVPEIFGDSNYAWDMQIPNLLYSVKNAAKIFTTTPSTMQDLISYAGVQKSRLQLLEMDFQPLEYVSVSSSAVTPQNYILWATNTTHHKNHINALDAYSMYSQELGGKLHLLITGTQTEYFDPKREFPLDHPVMQAPQVKYIREKLKHNRQLAKRIHIEGNLPDKIYAYFLHNSRFLWHPTVYDNGTFSVIEAAYLGVPALSSRYPSMEYINDKFNLNLRFCNPQNPKEMADALLHMEQTAADIHLPEQKALLDHSWQAHSAALYQAVTELLW